jgi:uncharacterized protein (DUF1499 family)
MRKMLQLSFVAIVALVAMSLFGCAGRRPSTLGVSDERLAACPSSPNCVSSDAEDESHRVSPFELAVPAAQAWSAVREAVAGIPRTRIVADADGYLHAECRSALMGFVDDLELLLRPSEGRIAVRSASRLGHSDLGVNRRRVESLRAALFARGVLR